LRNLRAALLVLVAAATIVAASPGVLTRSGWNKRTFNQGDKITLKFGKPRSPMAQS